MSENPEPFVRLHATYRGRLGVEVGVFVAVDHLRRAGRLTDADQERYFDIEDWFLANLPQPPFYDDGNSVGAVTWFKTATTAHMLTRLEPLCRLLESYDVAWAATETSDPGTVIYEDDFQVGAVPHVRLDPTPVPDGVALGPTTAESKRHLGPSQQ